MPPTKEQYKNYTYTKIVVFHEKELRNAALHNSKMTYLNVNIKGLNGRPHAALQNVSHTSQVKKLHAHVKFLCKDLYTFETRALYTGDSAACRLCLGSFDPSEQPTENTSHLLTTCNAFSDIRARIFLQYEIVCAAKFNFRSILDDSDLMTQFILDCTSLNLPFRILETDEICSRVFSLSRDLCFYIMKRRLCLLTDMDAA